jgi:hypothetical protein
MTYRDLHSGRILEGDVAGDRLAHQGTYRRLARSGEWRTGAIVGSIVAVVVVVAAIAYAMTRNPASAPSGPSTTMSEPGSTTGRGGTAH